MKVLIRYRAFYGSLQKKPSPLKDERLVSYCGGAEVDAVPLFYWNAAGVECRAFHRVGVIG